MSISDIEREVTNVLETYTIEEILEEAGVTPEEVLIFLLENEFITLPEVRIVT